MKNLLRIYEIRKFCHGIDRAGKGSRNHLLNL
jgi:hypothetical protein